MSVDLNFPLLLLRLIVPSVCQPLRRRILSGAAKLAVVPRVEQETRPKVNDSHSSGVGLDDDVLVLDVAVHDSRPVTAGDPLQYLMRGE